MSALTPSEHVIYKSYLRSAWLDYNIHVAVKQAARWCGVNYDRVIEVAEKAGDERVALRYAPHAAAGEDT